MRRRSGTPEQRLQTPRAAQLNTSAGVGDGGFDLAPVAHDRGVVHQRLDVLLGVCRHDVRVEAGEGTPEVRALAQDGQPGQAGLERFQTQPLQQGLLAVDFDSPLVIVVITVVRFTSLGRAHPRTAGTGIGADHDVRAGRLLTCWCHQGWPAPGKPGTSAARRAILSNARPNITRFPGSMTRPRARPTMCGRTMMCSRHTTRVSDPSRAKCT